MRLPSKIISRKSYVFLLFVLGAAVAFFINKLSKEYPYQLSFTACVYSSTEKTPANCAENLLRVRVRATGFYIMKYLNRPAQLHIDIKRVKATRTLINDHVEYNIPTSAIHGPIIEAVGNEGIKVEHILTETLLFENN
ncbi:MAG: hypothetical protein LBT49_05690 [Prevotellaceae bacterium]|jgi:hypothetical protein|nr:hypothetical protein [Prevotellaceae bacterium]